MQPARSVHCVRLPRSVQRPQRDVSEAPSLLPLPVWFAPCRKEGPCPKGTFSNREGVKLCSPCPVNTYSNGGGTAAASTPTYSCIKWWVGRVRGRRGALPCCWRCSPRLPAVSAVRSPNSGPF